MSQLCERVKAVCVERDDTSGILEAVEKGIYVIPAYKDLRPVAPDNVLCSSIWNREAGFADILNAHAEGRWDQIRSENWYREMTLANEGLELSLRTCGTILSGLRNERFSPTRTGGSGSSFGRSSLTRLGECPLNIRFQDSGKQSCQCSRKLLTRVCGRGVQEGVGIS